MGFFKKSQEQKLLSRALDFKIALGTEQGRRVLHMLMQEFWVMKPVHAPGDPITTAFRDGQRSVVLAILATLDIDVQKLEEQIKKNKETEESDEYE
jgi:hypothetical protein